MKVTADEIARLLADPPPRPVPAAVARAAQGGRGMLGLTIFGLLFGSFGMLFVLLFFPWRFLEDWRLSHSGGTAPGIVRGAKATKMSINDEPVVAYDFRYTPPDGRERAGVCYTTGRCWSPGARVSVRFLPGNPDLARIAGARLSQGGGTTGLMVLVFPLVGYGLVAWTFLSRQRIRRLLRDGTAAEVRVLAVDATKMRINYQTVYRVSLSGFPETAGQPLVVKRWAAAEINALMRRALQKEPIFVLYDPLNPKRLLFPETLIDP